MKKKILPLAIAAAMAPGFAAAAADVSGFANIKYTVTDDAAAYGGDGKAGGGDDLAKNPKENKFATDGEVDFSATPADGVTVRLDVDLMLDGGTGNSASVEQMFFAWGAMEGLTVIGGVFNNPIGMQGEDTTDWWGVNSGVIRNILDHQTARQGNNITGLAVAGAAGPVTITGAYLNDLFASDDENSLALVFNASPVEGLDLELGFVTQADQADSANVAFSAEDVTNFNAYYMIPGVEGLGVGLDYLTTGKVIDSAYEIMVDYTYDKFGVGVRTENVSWEAAGAQDSERTSFLVSYKVASNMKAVLEVADGDNANPMTSVTGIQADGLTKLKLLATF